MFALAIITTIISFLVSLHAHRRQIDLLDAFYETGQDIENPITKWVMVVNYISLFWFLSGVVSLIVFSGINLSYPA